MLRGDDHSVQVRILQFRVDQITYAVRYRTCSLRDCGHSFCFPCLRSYFATCLWQKASRDEYRDRVPRRLMRLDPLFATTSHIQELRAFIRRGRYRCPICSHPIPDIAPPIRVPVLQSLTAAIIGAAQNLDPSGDDIPIVTLVNGRWEGIFRM